MKERIRICRICNGEVDDDFWCDCCKRYCKEFISYRGTKEKKYKPNVNQFKKFMRDGDQEGAKG